MADKYSNKLKKHYYCVPLFFVLLVVIDQLIEVWVVNTIKDKPLPIIDGVLELHYLENTGAAFGMLKDKQWIFYLLTVIVLAAVIFLIIRIFRQLQRYLGKVYENESIFKKKSYDQCIFMFYTFAVLCAGAVGNMIDRIVNGYVVDYIYFKVINYPIFNFADICVNVSAIMLVIFFIFFYREDENLKIFGSNKPKKSKNKANEDA